MLGGDQRRLIEAQREQLVRKVALVGRVGLVRGEDHAAPRFAEELGDVAVDRSQALAGVHQEDDDVGLVDGDSRLGLDGGPRRILCGIEVEPGRVDHRELAAAPFGDAIQAIPRQPGLSVDDRLSLADQPVEEGRLADVRPADDRDDGPGHPHRIAEAMMLRTRPKPIVAAGLAIDQSTPATTLEARSPTPLTPFSTP